MIRELNVEEVDRCVPLASSFYKRLGLPGQFDGRVFSRTWRTMIERKAGMILARFKEGDVFPVEAIGCAIYSDFYTGEPTAAETFWFALFETGLAIGMLHEKLHELCKQKGIKQVFMTALCNKRFQKVSDFLSGKGYQLVEMVYRKDI